MEDLSHFRVEVNTGDELEELAHSFQYMVSELNEYIQNLSRVTAEKERIGAELDVARHIQASMLPCIFPAFPERHEFDIYASMTPAKEVGGDFYDFFLVDDDHLALVMADVSGKGVPAALFMMISKTLLKSAAQSGLSPKAVLEKVNDPSTLSLKAGIFGAEPWTDEMRAEIEKSLHLKAFDIYGLTEISGPGVSFSNPSLWLSAASLLTTISVLIFKN